MAVQELIICSLSINSCHPIKDLILIVLAMSYNSHLISMNNVIWMKLFLSLCIWLMAIWAEPLLGTFRSLCLEIIEIHTISHDVAQLFALCLIHGHPLCFCTYLHILLHIWRFLQIGQKHIHKPKELEGILFSVQYFMSKII